MLLGWGISCRWRWTFTKGPCGNKSGDATRRGIRSWGESWGHGRPELTKGKSWKLVLLIESAPASDGCSATVNNCSMKLCCAKDEANRCTKRPGKTERRNWAPRGREMSSSTVRMQGLWLGDARRSPPTSREGRSVARCIGPPWRIRRGREARSCRGSRTRRRAGSSIERPMLRLSDSATGVALDPARGALIGVVLAPREGPEGHSSRPSADIGRVSPLEPAGREPPDDA